MCIVFKLSDIEVVKRFRCYWVSNGFTQLKNFLPYRERWLNSRLFCIKQGSFLIPSIVFTAIDFTLFLKRPFKFNFFLLVKRGLLECNRKSCRNYFILKNTLDTFLAQLQTSFVGWNKETVLFNHMKAPIDQQECYLPASCCLWSRKNI